MKRRADLAAARPFSPEERLVLDALDKRLRQVLQGVKPAPTIGLEGHVLTAAYRTRRFSVHAIHKTGEIAQVPDGQLGPEHNGLLLKAWVERAGVHEAEEGAQNLRRPYWTTHLNAHPLSKASMLKLSLSYGSHTDRAVIEKLKEAVAAVAR